VKDSHAIKFNKFGNLILSIRALKLKQCLPLSGVENRQPGGTFFFMKQGCSPYWNFIEQIYKVLQKNKSKNIKGEEENS
jgi:hypothetical protein